MKTMKMLGIACTLGLVALSAGAEGAWVVRGARVADGTGKPLVAQDVRIEGDRIVEVGKLTPDAGRAGRRRHRASCSRPGSSTSTTTRRTASSRSPLARDAGLAGHHDARHRSRRRVALADRRVSAGPARIASRGQRDDDGRSRDRARARHGQGLPAAGHAGGDREDGRARRAGHARGGRGTLLRPRVRRRQLRVDTGAGRAREGLRFARRLLHDARPRRGGEERSRPSKRRSRSA